VLIQGLVDSSSTAARMRRRYCRIGAATIRRAGDREVARAGERGSRPAATSWRSSRHSVWHVIDLEV